MKNTNKKTKMIGFRLSEKDTKKHIKRYTNSDKKNDEKGGRKRRDGNGVPLMRVSMNSPLQHNKNNKLFVQEKSTSKVDFPV